MRTHPKIRRRRCEVVSVEIRPGRTLERFRGEVKCSHWQRGPHRTYDRCSKPADYVMRDAEPSDYVRYLCSVHALKHLGREAIEAVERGDA